MRRLSCAFLFAVTTIVSAADRPELVPASVVQPAVGRYLVTLSDATLDPVETVAARLAAQYGLRLEPFAREGFRGFRIVAPPARARLLSADPRVLSVDEEGPLPAGTSMPTPVAAPASRAPARTRTDAGGASLTIGAYGYDPAGNISTITGTTWDQFHYDRFGRLAKASFGSIAWQEYDYDRFGNLEATRTIGQAARSFGVDAASNRISDTSHDIHAAYDAAGNITALRWGVAGVIASFTWDGLNVATDTTVSGITRRHLYSATDERIASIDSTGFQRWTIRDPTGQVLRRFATSGTSLAWTEDYVYRGSAMLASFVPGSARVVHYHLDHLGTPRLLTGNGGVKLAEHRYYPFGEELTDPAQDGELKKFTGHERDLGNPGSADDFDYMHARHYATASGRFVSVDPTVPKEAARQPQLWNRYAYVGNNPMMRVDPDGSYLRLAGCIENWASPACGRQMELMRKTFGDKWNEAQKYLVQQPGGRFVLRGITTMKFGEKFGLHAYAIGNLANSSRDHTVYFNASRAGGSGAKTIDGDIYLNPKLFPQNIADVKGMSLAEAFVHEIGHALKPYFPSIIKIDEKYAATPGSSNDAFAVFLENHWRRTVLGAARNDIRTFYIVANDIRYSGTKLEDIWPPK